MSPSLPFAFRPLLLAKERKTLRTSDITLRFIFKQKQSFLSNAHNIILLESRLWLLRCSHRLLIFGKRVIQIVVSDRRFFFCCGFPLINKYRLGGRVGENVPDRWATFATNYKVIYCSESSFNSPPPFLRISSSQIGLENITLSLNRSRFILMCSFFQLMGTPEREKER